MDERQSSQIISMHTPDTLISYITHICRFDTPPPSRPSIHHLSEDLLRPIFEWATILSEDDSFHTAVIISHVCRTWRQVSLETSFLWTHVNLSVVEDTTVIKNIANNVFSRIGSRSPSLKITVNARYPGDQDPTTLDINHIINAVQLDRFKEIRYLHFHLARGREIKIFDHLVTGYSSGPLEELVFSTIPSSRGASYLLDFIAILHQFPTAKAIHISNMVLQTTSMQIHPSVEKITLRSVRVYWVAQVMSSFTSLTELTLIDTTLSVNPVFEDITLPSLQLLSFHINYGKFRIFPWKQLHAPKLAKLYLNYKIETEAEIIFITRHPTIRWFSGWLTNEQFTKLALIAPQIEGLDTMPFPTFYPDFELLLFIPPPSQDS